LTRVKELEENIMNFKEAIDSSCITNGELTIEFKEILKNIREGNQRVSPDKLKNVMGKINDIYYSCAQEDANEFISNFLDALLSETSDINSLDKLKIFEIDKNDKEAFKSYKTFCRKFYDKRGYSFLLDLFYGIIKVEKKCHNCGSINSIKFNPYNMFKLPIYEFYNNSSINFIDVLNKYFSRYKSEDISCKNCKQKELYIYTSIVTLPKYLIIFFGRIADDKYIRTNIIYPDNFDFYNYFNINKKNINRPNYILDCVIEHSGGLSSGHYTALCSINQKWYRFSDEYYSKSSSFQSQNAIILLYKSE
jgi:ubiquitin C-terminal hydrolase